jgi:hypothetical protein
MTKADATMSDNFFDPLWTERVTVPVKRVGDTWEFFYGGDVPVKEGTLGELSFSVTSIADEAFRQRVTSQVSFKILEEDTTLMVALSDRFSSKPYAEFDAKHFPQGIPVGTSRWARVRLGPPKEKKGEKPASFVGVQQSLIPEKGGLWLKLKGLEKCELVSSTVLMPDGFPEPTATSLNHAFTMLSREYEKHRISNTGNVYTRVFYQDRDDCWYPLDDLRRGVQAKVERTLLNELWAEVEKVLGWRPLRAPSGKRR